VAEVEIDPETGAVEVLAYTAVDDIGTVLSPVLAAGQVRGGIVQGAGQVFGECCIYDPDSGQLLTGSFMDYVMPHADLMCPIVIIDRPVPSPTNALGMKGVGESGTIGAAPALMNAIADALRGAGVSHFDMPATPMRLWAALDAAGRITADAAVG
jgi:aerobic carbon-monoxide dehydrogenase large subunit